MRGGDCGACREDVENHQGNAVELTAPRGINRSLVKIRATNARRACRAFSERDPAISAAECRRFWRPVTEKGMASGPKTHQDGPNRAVCETTPSVRPTRASESAPYSSPFRSGPVYSVHSPVSGAPGPFRVTRCNQLNSGNLQAFPGQAPVAAHEDGSHYRPTPATRHRLAEGAAGRIGGQSVRQR